MIRKILLQHRYVRIVLVYVGVFIAGLVIINREAYAQIATCSSPRVVADSALKQDQHTMLPAGATIIEAEHMALSGGYVAETKNDPRVEGYYHEDISQNGVRIGGDGVYLGLAQATFSLPDAYYDVYLSYVDENDGGWEYVRDRGSDAEDDVKDRNPKPDDWQKWLDSGGLTGTLSGGYESIDIGVGPLNVNVLMNGEQETACAGDTRLPHWDVPPPGTTVTTGSPPYPITTAVEYLRKVGTSVEIRNGNIITVQGNRSENMLGLARFDFIAFYKVGDLGSVTPAPSPPPKYSGDAKGWFHPGIDIDPIGTEAASRFVYSTHGGFVTYAGPAPAQYKEKGWMVQIETDLNRDNVPDVRTQYLHLMPNTITINDFKYKRNTYTPSFYSSYAASNSGQGVPYGYGPYVARNSMLARVGDSGSPGQYHVQYNIVTSRFEHLWGKNMDYFSGTCRDTPYITMDTCPAGPDRPDFFFPINHTLGQKVTAPVFLNPGFKNYSGSGPGIGVVYPAPTPAKQPPITPPDFQPAPPPSPPVSVIPSPPVYQGGECAQTSDMCGEICVINGQFIVRNLYYDNDGDGEGDGVCKCNYTYGDMVIGPPKADGGIDFWCFDNGVFPGDNYALCTEFGTPPSTVCARFNSGSKGSGCPDFDQTVCLTWN